MTSSDEALRLAAHEHVREAVDSLAHLGPASEIVDHCAEAAAAAADLDRAVLSRIDNGMLIVEHLHAGGRHHHPIGKQLRDAPILLAYPLLECELLRRKQARLVTDIDHSQPARYAFLQALQWREYIAAPIFVEGTAVGFLHGDRRPTRRPLAQLDADALEHFAAGFALVFERAVLRQRLRDQRREIRRISSWAEARTGDLSDGAIGLSAACAEHQDSRVALPELVTEAGLTSHLTAREIDVLRLVADGKTNGDIGRALFVSEGTVKFHVKNILRKMHASNRADASARYLRLTLNDGSQFANPTLR